MFNVRTRINLENETVPAVALARRNALLAFLLSSALGIGGWLAVPRPWGHLLLGVCGFVALVMLASSVSLSRHLARRRARQEHG